MALVFNKIDNKSSKTTECEVLIYEEIDSFWGCGPKQLKEFLNSCGKVDTIHVRINSPGGSVWDGFAIYNMLRAQDARKVVHVDGMAASIASIIAMAGDEIEVADNGFIMIHDPTCIVYGDSEEFKAMAALLDKIKTQLVDTYVARTKLPKEKVSELMDAETWMCGKECVDLGFADRCSGVLSVAAKFDASIFNHVPDSLRAKEQGEELMSEKTPATLAELKAIPGTTPEFREQCQEQNLTLVDAQIEWMKVLNETNKKLSDDLTAEKTKATAPTNKKLPGVPVDETPKSKERPTDAISDFDAMVRENMKNGSNRRRAIFLAARQDPELHEEYIRSTNKSKDVDTYLDARRKAIPTRN